MEQNKYEKLFDGFLDLTEFALIKYHDGFGLKDRQGGNLGDIESDRFASAEEIFDRMDVYITDYFLSDIENQLDEKEIEHGSVSTCEDALKYRNKLPESEWDFDVLDMICHHPKEICLSNCTFEEGESECI